MLIPASKLAVASGGVETQPLPHLPYSGTHFTSANHTKTSEPEFHNSRPKSASKIPRVDLALDVGCQMNFTNYQTATTKSQFGVSEVARALSRRGAVPCYPNTVSGGCWPVEATTQHIPVVMFRQEDIIQYKFFITACLDEQLVVEYNTLRRCRCPWRAVGSRCCQDTHSPPVPPLWLPKFGLLIHSEVKNPSPLRPHTLF